MSRAARPYRRWSAQGRQPPLAQLPWLCHLVLCIHTGSVLTADTTLSLGHLLWYEVVCVRHG
jgi:hypothetical protein